MRYPVLIIALVFFCIEGYGQNAVFLTHSTGRNLVNEGGVIEWIDEYNTLSGTNYQLTRVDYPTTPYTWDNYPYDYWNLWINGECDNGDSDIACLDYWTDNYDLVIWKHCFPGADIFGNTGPDITSSRKTLENYKLQYQALRDLMDSYPNKKFVVWTLVPVHRLWTSGVTFGARAREFVNWVKNDWLAEDGKDHPNIYIFDFFGYAAEDNPESGDDRYNFLRYEYERDHDDNDSHPNLIANQTIGPLFAEFVVNVLNDGIEDLEAPSIPGGLTMISFTQTSFFLSWTASLDNVGVTGYNIYRDGAFLESTTDLSYTDNTISECVDYSYTISAYDAAGNESSQSEVLVLNTCVPDVTPTITLSPNVANGVTVFELIVCVTELNDINTSGDIVIHIPKDLHWDISEGYNSSLASLGGTSLSNSEWTYSDDTDNHIFTSSTTILAGSHSTFGFRISFDPGGSTGMNPITSQLVSGGGGEVHVSNNSDSEQLDYFQ